MGKNPQVKRAVPHLFICLLLLLRFLALGVDVAGASQNMNASWSRQKAKDTAEEDQGNLSYSLNLLQEATDAISFNETLRYFRTREEGRETEFIDPTLRFSLKNDFFLFDTVGSASERRDSTGTDRSKQSWETTWASNWQRRFWPKLRASYAEDYDTDDEIVHLTDSKNIRESGSVDWDFELFRTYYNFNRTRDTDFADNSQDDATSHFGRFETGGNFFQNRLRYGFTQQISQNTSESTTAVGSGGTALIRRTISQAKTTNDNTPSKSDDVVFTSASALINGVRDVASGVKTNTSITDEFLNIAFAVDFNLVQRIYLYTKNNEAAVSGSFRFDLYTSSNSIDWQRISTNAPFTYNATERRFEFNVSPGGVRWLKLVVTQPAPSASHVVDFTELEIYQQVTTSGPSFTETSKTTTHITDFNTGLKVTDTVDLSYTLSMENGDYSSGVDYTRRSQAASLRWDPWENLLTTFDVNETREQNGTNPETLNRTYGTNIITLPLPTVDVTMNLSRTDQFTGKDLKSIGYDSGLFTTAALYPDLDSSLDLTYSTRKDEETSLVTKDYGSRLVFTARLIPSVTADISGDYQQTKSLSAIESFESTVTVNWRASDLLSFNTGARQKWQDWERESQAVNIGVALAPTEQLQLNFSVDYLKAKGRSNRYTSFLTWELGPFFTFQFDASYGQQEGEEDWAARGQFVARFASE